MLGGVIASMLGEPFIISAMLCAIAGPLVIFGANILLDVIPISLPGKDHGIYEFLLFSVGVAIFIAMLRLAG